MTQADDLQKRLDALQGTAYEAAYDAQSDFMEWANDSVAALRVAELDAGRYRKLRIDFLGPCKINGCIYTTGEQLDADVDAIKENSNG